MVDSLINQEPKTYDQQKWSLSLDNKEEVLGTVANHSTNRFSSSISSWNEHAASRSLFPTVRKIDEESISTAQSVNKADQSFLNRLKSILLGKSKIRNTVALFRNTTVKAVDSIKSYFSETKSDNKTQSKKNLSVASKKAETNHYSKVADTQSKAVIPLPAKDAEGDRIKEIESTLANYHKELENVRPDNTQKMAEMVYKILILVSSLRGRMNHNEIKQYLEHTEVVVGKKIKSMQGGRFWNWLTVGVQIAGAGLAFAPIGGIIAPRAKDVLQILGSASQPFGMLGQATGRIGEMDDQKRLTQRTEHEHSENKLKNARDLMVNTSQKIDQSIQQSSELWRAMIQADKAAKNAATAA